MKTKKYTVFEITKFEAPVRHTRGEAMEAAGREDVRFSGRALVSGCQQVKA